MSRARSKRLPTASLAAYFSPLTSCAALNVLRFFKSPHRRQHLGGRDVMDSKLLPFLFCLVLKKPCRGHVDAGAGVFHHVHVEAGFAQIACREKTTNVR